MACYRCISSRRASRGSVRFGTGGADNTYYVLGNPRGSGPHSILPEANPLPSVILEPSLGAGGDKRNSRATESPPLSALWPRGGLGRRGQIPCRRRPRTRRACAFSGMSSNGAGNSQVNVGGCLFLLGVGRAGVGSRLAEKRAPPPMCAVYAAGLGCNDAT